MKALAIAILCALASPVFADEVPRELDAITLASPERSQAPPTTRQDFVVPSVVDLSGAIAKLEESRKVNEPVDAMPPVVALPSKAATEAPADFALKDVPLNATTKAALDAAEPWMHDLNPPAPGQDGRIVYTFGAGQPQLVCSPLRVCIIELQPGEVVQGRPHVGDELRWMIQPLEYGGESGATPLIVVRPASKGLDTNMVIATNRRSYIIRLSSREHDHMPRIAFRYPDDEARAWAAAQAERDAKAATVVDTLAATSIDGLYFDYKVKGNRRTSKSLLPLRVFDDGTKTYVQMSADAAKRELPVLVLLSDSGKPEMVNYRVKGTMYVVDRLFDRAALLIGAGRKQSKITIVRREEPAPSTDSRLAGGA